MEAKGNAAERLLRILEGMKRAPGQTTLAIAWANTLECPDPKELFRYLADVIHLADEARQEISALPDLNHELFLAPFSNIDSLLSRTGLSQHWSDYVALVDETTLLGLRFAAERVSREGRPTAYMAGDEAKDLIADLNQMLEQVLASELPGDIKHLFRRNLEELRHALLTFRISGAQGVADEVDRTFGSISRHIEIIRMETPDAEKGLVEGVFKFLDRVNSAISFAQNATPLAPALKGLLESLSR
ncbi:hypothetical protein JE007_24175 [Pseudomonas aeruginosa]|uniref:hypothetical protein n=1 Tax=Pseudomonas aeruginosa TaxID=287 RepID=UPI0003B94D17|nr:hypothetical protein [Pseudomonas aeruginosa]ERY41892.1 hypothetical protein Q066_01575 [Pseudomonas aeruginosa BL12]MBI8135590.1 hypothetical protein [Pseudomonas aeruginosa]MBI8476209.1 hypothetical protein [Pseudomonas aeruginosa]MBI8665543.1 hypothetical protein [Pseudomonas aeruginosa]MBI8917582.1 hypothetical protein [Pseudomonas aeruginosa]